MLYWTYREIQFRVSRLDCKVYGADSEGMWGGVEVYLHSAVLDQREWPAFAPVSIE